MSVAARRIETSLGCWHDRFPPMGWLILSQDGTKPSRPAARLALRKRNETGSFRAG